MCGLTGFIDKKSKKEKQGIIQNMNDRISHRGPDSEGYYIDNNVALGFRRLSIIDLKTGDQPIYNEKEDMVILFNGEIYNFQELKTDLISKGHIFNTNTDTEVILHGYEEYKEKILDRLRGMFGFVIWDRKNKRLFGARDMFGIKPMYYYLNDDLFMFGSEIKSFMAHPDFKKELNENCLRPYLTFQYTPLDETFFKNVYNLKPGSYFIYENGKLDINTYYEVNFDSEDDSFEKYMDDIKDAVKESVWAHKISDVKVGSFLSSGVDSSYITATLMPNKTFTVGFSNKHFSEIEEASALSNILKIKSVNKVITADDFFSVCKKLQYYSDEPHANLSAVPLYFLSKLARKHVTVVLSGEGADELFGGYASYGLVKEDLKYRKIPKFIRKPIGKIAKNLNSFHGKNFLVRNGLDVEDYYIGQAFIFDEKEKKGILKPKYLKGLTYKQITKPYFDKVKDKDDITKMQYLDMHLWLPHDILLKADKMTMANSLELRVPFLDRKMMNLASKIPSSYKIKDTETKYIFRKCSKEVLPDEWVRRPKLGFPVPFTDWLKEDKYYNIIKEEFQNDYVSEFFYQDSIIDLLDKHHQNKKNNARKIWTIYTFLLWYKVYFIENW